MSFGLEGVQITCMGIPTSMIVDHWWYRKYSFASSKHCECFWHEEQGHSCHLFLNGCFLESCSCHVIGCFCMNWNCILYHPLHSFNLLWCFWSLQSLCKCRSASEFSSIFTSTISFVLIGSFSLFSELLHFGFGGMHLNSSHMSTQHGIS